MRSGGPGEEQVDSPAAAETPVAGKVDHEGVDGPNGGEGLHDEVMLAAFRHRGDAHTRATRWMSNVTGQRVMGIYRDGPCRDVGDQDEDNRCILLFDL